MSHLLTQISLIYVMFGCLYIASDKLSNIF